jgi:hypothetical protein
VDLRISTATSQLGCACLVQQHLQTHRLLHCYRAAITPFMHRMVFGVMSVVEDAGAVCPARVLFLLDWHPAGLRRQVKAAVCAAAPAQE